MAWIRNQDGKVLVNADCVEIDEHGIALVAYAPNGSKVELGMFTKKGGPQEFRKICEWISEGGPGLVYQIPELY